MDFIYYGFESDDEERSSKDEPPYPSQYVNAITTTSTHLSSDSGVTRDKRLFTTSHHLTTQRVKKIDTVVLSIDTLQPYQNVRTILHYNKF